MIDTEVLGRLPRSVAAPERLAVGARAGNWQIVAELGRGGCGIVYEARHVVLGRAAAVKVLVEDLARSQVAVDRFIGEARAVNAIGHPNIIDIFDIGTLLDGQPYLVMELLARDDLEARIARDGRMTVDDIVDVLAPIVDALEAAHRASYIHRDLKASNIGFTRDHGIPKLLDFGVAKLLEAGRDSGTGTLRAGSPHCMAPEQIRGEHVDARTDVYALGVLLYQMLTGCYPYAATDAVELERMHLEAPPPAPSRWAPVPRALDALVIQSLAKAPADRPLSPRAWFSRLLRAHRDSDAAVEIRVRFALPDPISECDVDAVADRAEATLAVLIAAGCTPVIATQTALVVRAPALTPALTDYLASLDATVEYTS